MEHNELKIKELANSLKLNVIPLGRSASIINSIYDNYESHIGFSVVRFQQDSHYIVDNTNKVLYIGNIAGCKRYLNKLNRGSKFNDNKRTTN